MNHGFLSGYLEGLQAAGVEAVLDPQPGECCVRLTTPSPWHRADRQPAQRRR
ncbi:hypothetical protein [Nonomuraea insulae]|uniref:Uncharacterized protein n=1 Tax=Nonomuraea insulae TaxID=1616787 RepID=A0ABW1CE18_9ACTN